MAPLLLTLSIFRILYISTLTLDVMTKCQLKYILTIKPQIFRLEKMKIDTSLKIISFYGEYKYFDMRT